MSREKRILVENARETGLEPATSDVTGQCSNQLNYSRKDNGYNRTRTYDHLCVRQALYQLSYAPINASKRSVYFTIQADFSQEIFSFFFFYFPVVAIQKG